MSSYSVSINENEPHELNEGKTHSRSFIKISLLCLAIFTAMVFVKYVRSSIDPSEASNSLDPDSERAIPITFSTALQPFSSASQLALAASSSLVLKSVGRHLLQAASPTIQSYIGEQVLTEEVSHSNTLNIPDVFKTSGGALSILAQQPPNLPLTKAFSVITQRKAGC